MNASQINSIILFAIITLGMGYSVLWLTQARRSQNPFVATLELLAIGLATFSFIGVVFQLFHIPLHLFAYLLFALIIPVIVILKGIIDKDKQMKTHEFSFRWKSEETICAILLIIILGFFFSVFLTGANTYPYLEDDDPWNHALASTYIAREHTYNIDPAVRELNSGYAFYLEPYPPTYDIIMGVMRQTTTTIVWTLKFYNVLLITLGLAFCYLLTKQYLKSDLKALFATFILATLPSFMSHFIWSQTIAVVLFPVALYAMLKAIDDSSWRIPAILAIASELVTQPVVSFVFGIVVLMMVGIIFFHESLNATWKRHSIIAQFPKTKAAFTIGFFGVMTSFLYWGAQIWKWGIGGITQTKGGEITTGWAGQYALQTYTFNEIFFPPNASRIDQAIGWGSVLTILIILTLLVFFILARKTINPQKGWLHLHLLVWFMLLAYAVFAPSFGLPGWGSSRSWAYLAIPVALLTTEGAFMIINGIAGKQYLLKLAIILVTIIGIGLTSIPAKIAVQTAYWPPGAHWTAPDVEVQGYLMMQQKIPANSRVFAFCGGDLRAVGFDMQSDPWNYDVSLFRRTYMNKTGGEIVAFLEQYNYEYITMDATCVRELGENGTTELGQKLTGTGRFIPVSDIQQPGFLLAQIQTG